MRELARRPEKDRRELFRATAQAMRVHEAIIEKDFWVCWILKQSFSALRKDYCDISAMLFGDPPSFEDILEWLSVLEKRINRV